MCSTNNGPIRLPVPSGARFSIFSPASNHVLIRGNLQLIHPQQDCYIQDQLSSPSNLVAYSQFSRPSTSVFRHPSHYSPYPSMDHHKNKESPVPIPNLIKKSRGRRVPTEAESDELGGGPSKARMFRCDVHGCGKCFLRGEHLKRHIRSIHTHEKRSSASILFSSRPAPNLMTAYKCVVPSCGKHFSRRDNLVQHLKIHKDLDVSALASALPPSPPFSFQDFSDYERKSVSPVATSDDSSYSASPSPPHQHQTTITGMGLPEPQYLINDTFDRFLMTNITMAVSSLQEQEPASSTGADYFYDASIGAMPQYVQQERLSFNQHSAYSLSPPVSSLPQNPMPVHYFYQ